MHSLGQLRAELRQLAVVLNTETEVYGALVDIISVCFDMIAASVGPQLQAVAIAESNRDEDQKVAANKQVEVLGMLTLMAVVEKLNSYFGENQSKPGGNTNDSILPSSGQQRLCREALLAMNGIFSVWLGRGYRPEAIRATISALLLEVDSSRVLAGSFNDAAFLHALTEVRKCSAYELVAADACSPCRR